MPDTELIERVARELLRAEDERRDLEPFTDSHPDLDEAAGYRVQDRTLALRIERGERVEGIKLGLTSKAKQQRMKVETPIIGWITDAHRLPSGEPIAPGRFIHPRVEPEIFVTLERDLKGPVTADQVRGAIGSVYAGLDVIDSRYRDFRFTLGDVVADNASGAGFIVGPVARRVDEIDLLLEAVVVEVDGTVVDTATGAAILGHPLEAVAAGVNLLARRGLGLKAGDTVLAGALTDAVPVNAGSSIAFHFSTLGSIHLPAPTEEG